MEPAGLGLTSALDLEYAAAGRMARTPVLVWRRLRRRGTRLLLSGRWRKIVVVHRGEGTCETAHGTSSGHPERAALVAEEARCCSGRSGGQAALSTEPVLIAGPLHRNGEQIARK